MVNLTCRWRNIKGSWRISSYEVIRSPYPRDKVARLGRSSEHLQQQLDSVIDVSVEGKMWDTWGRSLLSRAPVSAFGLAHRHLAYSFSSCPIVH